jgi:hypothetical protein
MQGSLVRPIPERRGERRSKAIISPVSGRISKLFNECGIAAALLRVTFKQLSKGGENKLLVLNRYIRTVLNRFFRFEGAPLTEVDFIVESLAGEHPARLSIGNFCFRGETKLSDAMTHHARNSGPETMGRAI